MTVAATGVLSSIPIPRAERNAPGNNPKIHALETLRAKIAQQKILLEKKEPAILHLAKQRLPSYIKEFKLNVLNPHSIEILSIRPQGKEALFSNRVDVLFADSGGKQFALDMQLLSPSEDFHIALKIFMWAEAAWEYLDLLSQYESELANARKQMASKQLQTCPCVML